MLHSFFAELLPVLSALLTAIISYGAILYIKKLKVQLSQEEEDQLRLTVRNAINGAEEWAARKMKLEKASVNGLEKASWVHERVKQSYSDLTSEELDKLIDEELTHSISSGASAFKEIPSDED